MDVLDDHDDGRYICLLLVCFEHVPEVFGEAHGRGVVVGVLELFAFLKHGLLSSVVPRVGEGKVVDDKAEFLEMSCHKATGLAVSLFGRALLEGVVCGAAIDARPVGLAVG